MALTHNDYNSNELYLFGDFWSNNRENWQLTNLIRLCINNDHIKLILD